MGQVKFVVLYTDVVLWMLVLLLALYARHVLRTPELARKWQRVWANRTAQASAAVLVVFLTIACVDSVHFRRALPPDPVTHTQAWETETVSLMDVWVREHIAGRERSYSAPFALREFDKTTVIENGKPERVHARLVGASPELPEAQKTMQIMRAVEKAVISAAVLLFGLWFVAAALAAVRRRTGLAQGFAHVAQATRAYRPAFVVWQLSLIAAVALVFLWPHWHVLGTDTTGNDVLYSALKSVRTAMVIGTLATLTTLPFAVILGMAAGYFKGRVDDVIQYIYTTISSIPSVLLIAASVLMVQVFIDNNPTAFSTGLERADVRLFLLACIIGMTGWAGLARLLRAETMKVSVSDYVMAARAFGVSHAGIMARHIFPNVVHIVLIVTVLDFSGIVLYEAVLSYVGVGVDPTMHSFGSMINAAAVEMSRTPVIWWNLTATFVFMVALVLSANLFAAGVRDAFDPRGGSRG